MATEDRTENSPDVLLFDLGGVLVRWAGVDSFVALAGNRLDRETVRRAWLESPWFRRFETGRCSPEEFASNVVREFGLAMSGGEFLREWTSWVEGPHAGALELLDSLAPRYTLACLSNTNEPHWKKIRDDFGFGPRFERCYISYEIGAMKPDDAIFEHVLGDLKRPARQIVFFDDNPECVSSAARLGFRAHLARGPADVSEVVSRLG